MGDKLITAGEATPEAHFKWLMLGEKYWIDETDESGVPVKENYGAQTLVFADARSQPHAPYEGKTNFTRPPNLSLDDSRNDWNRLQEVADLFYSLDDGRSANGNWEKYPELLFSILDVKHKLRKNNEPEGFIVPKGYMLRKMVQWLWESDSYLQNSNAPVRLFIGKAQYYWDTYMRIRGYNFESQRDEDFENATWPEFYYSAMQYFPLSRLAGQGYSVEKDDNGNWWDYSYEVPQEEQNDKRMWWVKYPYELLPLLLKERKTNGKECRAPQINESYEGHIPGFNPAKVGRRSWF